MKQGFQATLNVMHYVILFHEKPARCQANEALALEQL